MMFPGGAWGPSGESHGEKAIPDSITPVEGWRMWFMRQDPPRLRSYYLNHLWPVGEPTRAGCLGQRRVTPKRIARWFGAKPRDVLYRQNDHRSPADDCMCGIWGLYQLETLNRRWTGIGSFGGPRVVGRARGWGRVTLGTEGWRAEVAEIMCLIKPPSREVEHMAAELAEVYGVPLISTEEAEAWDLVEAGARSHD